MRYGRGPPIPVNGIHIYGKGYIWGLPVYHFVRGTPTPVCEGESEQQHSELVVIRYRSPTGFVRGPCDKITVIQTEHLLFVQIKVVLTPKSRPTTSWITRMVAPLSVLSGFQSIASAVAMTTTIKHFCVGKEEKSN